LFIYSDIDTKLNDGTLQLLNQFKPEYVLLNGKQWPDTEAVVAETGKTILIRQVNLGLADHTFGFTGLRQVLLGRDGGLAGNAGSKADAQSMQQERTLNGVTVPVGHSADTLIAVPAVGTVPFTELGGNLKSDRSAAFGGGATVLESIAARPPVVVGNALVDRAYSTDYPPIPTGATLAPVFVALSSTPLPAGTLQSFQSWNQATGGGSPAPSAGNQFRAYVLHPTGVANQYSVLYASDVLTVPPLSGSGSEAASYPVAPGVVVSAGDVIAFYGEGIPLDTTSATDVVSYPALADPAQGSTITLGGTDFPLIPNRTYSFAATVQPA
jgi:hypothetical protein